MLPDKDKTKEQLVSELAGLRQRVAELEIVESERKWVEHDLKERVKELQCLYGMAYIVERPGITLDELCQEVVSLLPAGWQYPEIACARMTLGDKEFKTDNFRTTEWKQPANINVKGQKEGTIEVYYLEERPELDEGPFSKDERLLLDVVAERLNRVIERKQVEEELRESEENFRRSLDDSPLGVRIIGPTKGETLYANRAILDIYGYSSVEEFRTTPAEKRLTPESYAELMIRREKWRRGEYSPSQYEMSIVRKDGEIRPLQVFRKEVLWNGERRLQVIYQDITERKQAEEREEELQREISVSRRLAAAGELAAGVAHEINNPLTGVLGFSERLLRKNTDEEIRQDLERIHSEAQRMVKVMDNLRTFTRRREPEKQYSGINDVLQTTLELRAYELRTGNIEIVTVFTPSLPEVEVDSHQIQEVFLNIILNAEQVMTEANGGGKLTIKTGKIKDYVRISFADDGPGISAEHLDKVFDPFFTTRGGKGGTGLGLSVCHGIVAGHGADYTSKANQGKEPPFLLSCLVLDWH